MRINFLRILMGGLMGCGQLVAADGTATSASASQSVATSAPVTIDLSEENSDLPKPKPKEDIPSYNTSMSSLRDYSTTDLTIRGKQEEQVKPQIVSSTQTASSYYTDQTTSYSKIPMKISETPGTVQVISSQMIEEQDDLRVKDALRNVPGVAMDKNEGYAIQYENSFVRGFQQNTYRNGYRAYGMNTIDTATVDRIEVIKGPSSVNYGLTEPGGIVNVVTKGAELTPHKVKAKAVVGMYDDYRQYVDMGGSVSEKNDKAYRLNMSHLANGSFRDSVNSEAYTIAPAFLWKFSDSTTLDLRVDYKHETRKLDDGLAFDYTGHPIAAIDTFLGEPTDSTLTLDNIYVDGVLTHQFTEWLTMRTRLNYHYFNNDMAAVRHTQATTNTNRVARFYDASDFTINEVTAGNDFIFHFDGLEGVDETFVIGAEYRDQSYAYHQLQDNNATTSTRIPSLSITEPAYGTRPYRLTDSGTSMSYVDWVSPYAQNTLKLFDERLILTAGARLDNVWAQDVTGSSIMTENFSFAPTGSVGALYKLFSHFYPFATISSSFMPQGTGTKDQAGNTLDPETAGQIEGGFKSPFCNDRFLFTTSVYRIDKENVAVSDPTNTAYRVNGGKMRSQGIEFSGQGEIASGWDILGGYAYTDTDVLESNVLREGNHFRGIPLNSGNFWLTHTHKSGKLKGLKYGPGMYLVDDRPGDSNDSFTLPGYITVDMMVSYQRTLVGGETFRTQLNLHNVMDQKYYESSFVNSRVMPGSPFTGSLTVGVEF